MTSRYLPIILSLTIFTLIFHSCGNDDTDGKIQIEFEFTSNGKAIDLNDQLTINGTSIKFEVANYYVSGFGLIIEEDAILNLGPEYYIAAPNKLIDFDEIFENGNITGMAFFIGVDATTNSQTETDFTTRSTEDPLGIQDPSMHWNWASGYKFFRLDGDADLDNDGTFETPIAYHIGTDNLLRFYSKDLTKSLGSGVNNITLSLEFDELFNGVDFQIESNWDTHTANNPELAKLLVDNMETAFSVR